MLNNLTATAYKESGRWLVHAVDIGATARVTTRREIRQAARKLYADRLCIPVEMIIVRVQIYRWKPSALRRRKWLRGRPGGEARSLITPRPKRVERRDGTRPNAPTRGAQLSQAAT